LVLRYFADVWRIIVNRKQNAAPTPISSSGGRQQQATA
jgi:hypothetical protein